jgi:hypothetical protein
MIPSSRFAYLVVQAVVNVEDRMCVMHVLSLMAAWVQSMDSVLIHVFSDSTIDTFSIPQLLWTLLRVLQWPMMDSWSSRLIWLAEIRVFLSGTQQTTHVVSALYPTVPSVSTTSHCSRQCVPTVHLALTTSMALATSLTAVNPMSSKLVLSVVTVPLIVPTAPTQPCALFATQHTTSQVQDSAQTSVSWLNSSTLHLASVRVRYHWILMTNRLYWS